MTLGARARIRLDALTHNFNLLKNAVPGARVLAAVKANAYGHGLTTIATALKDSDALAVARLVEARYLREAGVDLPIVLMAGVLGVTELRDARSLCCDMVVHSDHLLKLLEVEGHLPNRVWLKVDTGMHRLGVAADAVPAMLQRLRRLDIKHVGLMTHLASADDLEDGGPAAQFEKFRALCDGFDGDVSIANSAALLGWSRQMPAATLKQRGELWVRPGISLYGISPLTGQSAASLELRPVMQFETVLVAVKAIERGARVGYGGRWRADRDTVIGIAAAGYGDGYSRFLPSGTPVLVNGRRAALAGVVSMDLLAIDLGPDATDQVGDPVVLWGDGLPVEEVATWGKTTAYPLVTGVTDRQGLLR